MTPWDLLGDDLRDPDIVAEALKRYYASNRVAVRREFTSRLRGYEIDDKAKSLFREALTAHGRGLYRVCIRSLFPEIDCLARTELPPVKGGPIAALTAAAGEIGMSEIEPGGWYGLQLFTKLKTQAYATVWTDEEAVAAASFQAPSRHAALHGRVAYSSRQHSINALIMADYAFQVINQTKQNSSLGLDNNRLVPLTYDSVI